MWVLPFVNCMGWVSLAEQQELEHICAVGRPSVKLHQGGLDRPFGAVAGMVCGSPRDKPYQGGSYS